VSIKGLSALPPFQIIHLSTPLFTLLAHRDSPGPCSYSAPSSVGKQPCSRYATNPAYKQGTSQRFPNKNASRDVPGAGTYASDYASVGKQALSTKPTLPSPKMGTGDRETITTKVRCLQACDLHPMAAAVETAGCGVARNMCWNRATYCWGAS
jgi:hypothetical protein